MILNHFSCEVKKQSKYYDATQDASQGIHRIMSLYVDS